jgi:hypothetical protein
VKLGERVTYQGRRYILRGLDPFGVSDRRGYLEDAETHALVKVPLDDVRSDEESPRGPAETGPRRLARRVFDRIPVRRA